MSDAAPVAQKQKHIYAIDFMRIFIIALVIATHVVATGPIYGAEASGAIWMVSHISRNLFLILTAFVLFYQYSKKPIRIGAFYKKRFPLILLPYATWTLIYQVQDGIQQHSFYDFAATYVQNFLHATAMYHLYFLLLSAQIYLLMPLILWVWRKINRYSLWVLAGSFLLQLGITYAAERGQSLNFLGSIDNFLFNYQFYVVFGCWLGVNFSSIAAALGRWRYKLLAASVIILGVGQALYWDKITKGIYSADAAAVFQPYLVVETAICMLLLMSWGIAWEQNGMRWRRFVTSVGVNSFGIYLVHIFIINKLKFLQPDSAAPLVVVASVAIGIPVVYGLSFAFTEIARQTPFSLILTGRARNQHSWKNALMQRRAAKQSAQG